METALGNVFAVGDLGLDPHALVAREGIENPDDIELLLALGIVDGGDVHAVVELLFVAQDLQEISESVSGPPPCNSGPGRSASMPDPYCRLSLATMGMSQGVGTGPAGLAGAVGFGGAAAAGFSGTAVAGFSGATAGGLGATGGAAATFSTEPGGFSGAGCFCSSGVGAAGGLMSSGITREAVRSSNS